MWLSETDLELFRNEEQRDRSGETGEYLSLPKTEARSLGRGLRVPKINGLQHSFSPFLELKSIVQGIQNTTF